MARCGRGPARIVAPELGSARLTRAAHILVVDNDAPVRMALTRLLGEAGYEATGLASGAHLDRWLRLAKERPVDLILLDDMMPAEDGVDLCAHLRARSPAPIIMVSARSDELDRVRGLDAGADDYIPKPFGKLELLARVRAALRRSQGVSGTTAPKRPNCYIFNGWRFYPQRRELTAPTGKDVSLTAAEHDLLLTLLRHAQRTIGRERLLELVRRRAPHSSDRSIDVLVSRLRRKLSDARGSEGLIRSVRGVGYTFVADLDYG